MIDQQKTVSQLQSIDQLWYTWSDVGIDTITAGFRIRAVSEGLYPEDFRDERNLRLQELDRYQRYSLPQGVNPVVISLNMAPICLSLITTEHERILVHKAYAGKDGVGRYGSFFIHLLAGLPREFSARDAISLWKSPFWQVSDTTLDDRNSTRLDCITPNYLKTWSREIPLTHHGVATIERYLPYIIQAYLTKKTLIDQKTGLTIPQKLYIAASDDDIALLISGLTRCLPEQFLHNLTFSTYERDVTEATTEIIGTCWLSIPEAEKNPEVEQLLPPHFYQEKLAINCYTGNRSHLENNPLVHYKPLAGLFAHVAGKYFVRHTLKPDTDILDEVHTQTEIVKGVVTVAHFEWFLNLTKGDTNLEVDEFLTLHECIIVRTANPLDANIDFALAPRSDFKLKYTIALLSIPGYQQNLINRALRDQEWWRTNGRNAILRICEQSRSIPQLANALSQMAQVLFPQALDIARRGTSVAGVTISGAPIPNKEAAFTIIVDFMLCADPPDKDPPMWLSFFKELLSISNILVFLDHYWIQNFPSIEGFLQQLLQYPQLGPAAESLLDTLRALHLARLTPDKVAQYLIENGPRYLPFPKTSKTILAMFGELATHDTYAQKMKVLESWLASAQLFSWFHQDQGNLETILKTAHLDQIDSERLLEKWGEEYIRFYPHSKILSAYLEHYLKNLSIRDIAIFKSNTSSNIPSEAEKFLGFLSKQSSLHPNVRQSAHDWYFVGAFVRNPSILKQKQKEVATSIGGVLKQPLQHQIWTAIINRQAAASLEGDLADSIDIMSHSLLPKELLQLLYQIALKANDGVRKKRHSKSIFISCIVILFTLDTEGLFRSENEQIAYIHAFLKALLQDMDQKTLKWLYKIARKWPTGIYAQWRRYGFHYIPSGAVAKSPWFERIELWWERTVAFTQIRLALRSTNNYRKIVQVGTNYMTTLNSPGEEIPEEWRNTLDRAFDFVNAEENNEWDEWERDESQNKLKNATIPPPEKPGAARNPMKSIPRFERIMLRWQRTVAFTQMRLALSSKHIGKIVRVATNHMLTLKRYDTKVPAEWWRQIDAAFDFFLACEEADESKDEHESQAIISSCSKIDDLVFSGHPAPILTAHEKRRKEAAIQQIVDMDKQRMKATR